MNFTFETGEDCTDKWLPTQDTSLRLGEDNVVEYKYYEKPTTTNSTIRKISAMGENTKILSLSNDLVRRLVNTKVELHLKYREDVVDQYARKLFTSGYRKEQVQRILLNGIKGYITKKSRRQACGRGRIHHTSQESLGGRIKKKLLGKSSWYRKTSDEDQQVEKKLRGGASTK